jgi:hypothetical protein
MKKILLTLSILIFSLTTFGQAAERHNTAINTIGDITYGFTHAAAYAENISYTPNLTQNVYTKLLPSFTISEATNITIAGDSMTIITPGDYLILFTITLSGANGDDFRIKLYKNNAITGINGSNHITTTGAPNYTSLSYFWYSISLVLNDKLSFRMTNTTNNGDPTISDIKFYIEKKPG